jgi:hypothetical protein
MPAGRVTRGSLAALPQRATPAAMLAVLLPLPLRPLLLLLLLHLVVPWERGRRAWQTGLAC